MISKGGVWAARGQQPRPKGLAIKRKTRSGPPCPRCCALPRRCAETAARHNESGKQVPIVVGATQRRRAARHAGKRRRRGAIARKDNAAARAACTAQRVVRARREPNERNERAGGGDSMLFASSVENRKGLSGRGRVPGAPKRECRILGHDACEAVQAPVPR